MATRLFTALRTLAPLALLALAAPASGDSGFAATDSGMVEQDGKSAAAIRANLKKIRLPKGFQIELYALVPDARYLAVAPQGEMVMVGTRKSRVWAIAPAAGAGQAEVRPFAPAVKFSNPNGVCWSSDGALFVVESNRVLAFVDAAQHVGEASPPSIAVVPEGSLIPVEEQSYNNSGRVCRVSAGGKLYVSLGQPYNVQPPEKIELYDSLGIGGVIRMNADGSDREVVAVGMRNPAGIDLDPRDETLWATDNQVDGLGDDVPPGELNHVTSLGQHFGFPYWNGHFKVAGSVAAPELRQMPAPLGAVFPQAEFPAHQAQLGMVFYRGSTFPAAYRKGIFVAAHGSWNRSVPSGYLVNFVPVDSKGKAGKPKIFASGFLGPRRTALGRPVDVANLPDGSLLVSDDHAGALYRISYRSK